MQKEIGPGKEGRIQYIDFLRAFAILMMLQGHVVGLLLAKEHADTSHRLYFVWSYMRGLTAPVFFLGSGLIFTYLLFRKQDRKLNTERLAKGFRRGLFLIGLGYLLQFNRHSLLFVTDFDFSRLDYLIHTHVLHCIGVGLWVVCLLYLVSHFARVNFIILGFVAFNVFFLLYPQTYSADYSHCMPTFLANYLTRVRSAFPVVPWLGYVMMGSVLGYLNSRFSLHRKAWFFVLLIVLGFLIRKYSWPLLKAPYSLFVEDPDEYLAICNVLYFRLGEALIVAGLAGLIARFVAIPGLILKIGSQTLFIYFFHVIVVYGSIFGIGLNAFKYTFDPWQTAGMAAIVEIVFILLVWKIEVIHRKVPLVRFVR